MYLAASPCRRVVSQYVVTHPAKLAG